jgi:hypothetical protein
MQGYVLYESNNKMFMEFAKEEVPLEIYSKPVGICSETIICNSDFITIIDFNPNKKDLENNNAEWFI